MSILDETADRWVPEPNTGCYLWLGSITNRNRPRIKRGGITKKIARLVCEEIFGPPPTPQHEAAHATPIGCLGDVCVSPFHLRWASKSENQQDIPEKERSERVRRGNMAAADEQRRTKSFEAIMRLTPEQRKERSRKMHAAKERPRP